MGGNGDPTQFLQGTGNSQNANGASTSDPSQVASLNHALQQLTTDLTNFANLLASSQSNQGAGSASASSSQPNVGAGFSGLDNSGRPDPSLQANNHHNNTNGSA
jgi:hypothetical protein